MPGYSSSGFGWLQPHIVLRLRVPLVLLTLTVCQDLCQTVNRRLRGAWDLGERDKEMATTWLCEISCSEQFSPEDNNEALARGGPLHNETPKPLSAVWAAVLQFAVFLLEEGGPFLLLSLTSTLTPPHLHSDSGCCGSLLCFAGPQLVSCQARTPTLTLHLACLVPMLSGAFLAASLQGCFLYYGWHLYLHNFPFSESAFSFGISICAPDSRWKSGSLCPS